MNKKIVLTGGGTAGHVNPNIALLDSLRDRSYEIFYVGSFSGIEKKLIEQQNIPYYGISTGKLRRYLSAENIKDFFRVFKGIKEAKKVLKEISPDIVFSKGGYVSVPVVRAAYKLNIPVIIHESDSTPGLANRISFKYVNKICASFPETMRLLPSQKSVLTGTPIREALKNGDKSKGLSMCGFSGNKPVITVMGGSLGAVAVNNTVREALPELLKDYDVIHLCGAGNLDCALSDTPGYIQFEYIGEELPDIFAATDIMISRSGANAIFEILSLCLPNILIPLPGDASRGDQILNANSFYESGYSFVLMQENLTVGSLTQAVSKVYSDRDSYIQAMKNSTANDAVKIITNLIEEVLSSS